jgi:hypothetical protein
MRDADSEPSPVSLTWPFALAGLAGGWLSADCARPHDGGPIRGLLIGVTPIVAALLGHFMTARVHGGPLRTTLLTVGSVLVAGTLNGALIGLFVGGALGLVFGGVFGVFFAFPFLPPLVASALFARRVGRARRGSAVDRADRRAVWVPVILGAALAVLIPVEGIFGRFQDRFELVLPAAAFGALLAFLLFDAMALAQVRAGRIEGLLGFVRTRAGEGARPFELEAVKVVDAGLGDQDERVEERAPAASAYRDRERILRVFCGDLFAAQQALAWASVLDLSAALLAFAALLLRVA